MSCIDPRNPDVLLATTWQRVRRTYGYMAGGPESGLWRSTDGGATWKKSQTGMPTDELGRIGLAHLTGESRRRLRDASRRRAGGGANGEAAAASIARATAACRGSA